MKSKRGFTRYNISRPAALLRVFVSVIVFAGLHILLSPGLLYAGQDFSKVWEIDRKWVGDYDGMVERRLIRVLGVHNKMLYFLDKGRQRGGAYELVREFEKYVNKKHGAKLLKIQVVFIPVRRDQLLPMLNSGQGDIAVANLTITEERRKEVGFSDPFLTGVSEILVTGQTAPKIAVLSDLSGKEVHVRLSSSYYEHLLRLNKSFATKKMEPVKIIVAEEYLEDSDLLEMVNAGLIPMVFVDSHKAGFWVDIFKNIKLHSNISINSGGRIAWAFRKSSPQLENVVNEFIRNHKKGTLLGNVLLKRYLINNKWARNSLSKEELKKFRDLVGLFKKYSSRYQFDYLMIGALAYQESQLDHSKRSPVGAVGIMQILPSTAADRFVGITTIENLEDNIHAGTKYLRFLSDRYFNDPAIDPLNRMLLAFASYNAGPAKVARLRKEAKEMGLDPNIWFQNVEVVAAKRIGRETVQYVSNIYKYYIAYKLVVSDMELKRKTK